LVEEAGGRVSDMSGSALSITASDHLLADNGLLHEEVVRMFGAIFGGRSPVEIPELR
jgi:fructose-1,6-bisphosphatase/inositol monophosphatase family enzyme